MSTTKKGDSSGVATLVVNTVLVAAKETTNFVSNTLWVTPLVVDRVWQRAEPGNLEAREYRRVVLRSIRDINVGDNMAVEHKGRLNKMI